MHTITSSNMVGNDLVQKVWPHLRTLGFQNVSRQMVHFNSAIESDTSQESGKYGVDSFFFSSVSDGGHEGLM